MSTHLQTYLNAAMYWLGHIAPSIPDSEISFQSKQMTKVLHTIKPYVKDDYQWMQIFARVAQYYITRSRNVYGTLLTPSQAIAVAYHLTDVVNNDCTIYVKSISNATGVNIPHTKQVFLETIGYKVYLSLTQMSHLLTLFVSHGQNPIVA